MVSANDFRGHVEIELDGKKRLLRFNHSALRQLESKHGPVMAQGRGVSLGFIIDAIAAGIAHHGDKSMTPAKLESMIPTYEVLKYAEPVSIAIMLAYQGPEAVSEFLAASGKVAETSVAVDDENPPPPDTTGPPS
jgi:hypothetical protein